MRIVDDEPQVLFPLWGRPADEAVARGDRPGGNGKAEQGLRCSVVGMHGVAHLGAGQVLLAEVAVAGNELVSQRSPRTTVCSATGRTLSMVVGDGSRGGSVSSPKLIGPGQFWLQFDGGSLIRRSLCIASITNWAIMSLRSLSGLFQPTRRLNSLDRTWRLLVGGLAISVRSNAISSAEKSRP